MPVAGIAMNEILNEAASLTWRGLFDVMAIGDNNRH
jgi:hypothetical protein